MYLPVLILARKICINIRYIAYFLWPTGLIRISYQWILLFYFCTVFPKQGTVCPAYRQIWSLWLGMFRWKMSIPKVSTVHPGIAGTFTHMDGNDERRKERKKNSWRAKNKNILETHTHTHKNNTRETVRHPTTWLLLNPVRSLRYIFVPLLPLKTTFYHNS